MEINERLQNLKTKIQEKGRNELLGEMRQLNRSFVELKYLISGAEKVEAIKDNEELINMFKEMNQKIQGLSDKNDSVVEDIKKIQRPLVKMPSDVKISNIDEARQKDVNIDWKNMPKTIIPDKVKIDGLDKSLEKIIPKDEMPENATMELKNDLWSKVTINYPSGSINVKIDRNDRDIIRKLTFARG